MTRRFVPVTFATTTARRFSFAARSIKARASFSRTTTAMRSCDSEIASSVPFKPSYFLGTASRSMSSPAANSPTATDTPPAPKSFERRIIKLTFLSRKRRCIFRSSTALPFCTSAPALVTDSLVCTFDEPVAPPMPSRPVPPPSKMTTSPASGLSRTTESAGEAAMTAPHSMRFAP